MKTLLLAPMFLAVASAQDSLSILWSQGPAEMVDTIDLTFRAAKITISICNFGNLPEPWMVHTRSVTESVLRSAAIEVAWRSCEKPAPPPAIPWFVIRLWDEKPPHMIGLASFDAMGRAFAGKNGTGNLADIYFESIRNLATLYACNADILLAYAIAHEIGHLLGLGHAGCGVMKEAWGVGELKAQGQRAMNFSQQEAARLRNQLRAMAAEKEVDH